MLEFSRESAVFCENLRFGRSLSPKFRHLKRSLTKGELDLKTESTLFLHIRIFQALFMEVLPSQWHGRFATRFARIDSRESIAIETPIFIAHQADSHESLEFPIRVNHATKVAMNNALNNADNRK